MIDAKQFFKKLLLIIKQIKDLDNVIIKSIQNQNQITFGPALSDWGWISGVVIADSGGYGAGNILMFASLENPRLIYTGDSIKFDARSLEISLK